MSGTFKLLLVVGLLVSSSQAAAFDIDAEIAKQNKIYGQITPSIGKKSAAEAKAQAKADRESDVKVLLISKK